MTQLTSLLLPMATGALVGLGLYVAVLAVVGLPERDPGTPRRFSNLTLRGVSTRLLVGLGAGLLTLLLTRWVVAAVGIGLLAGLWDQITGDARGETQGISKLEALATWTESLRDTIAGAVGLEQAIPATAVNANPAIRSSLNLLVDRLRIREPLPDALIAFAEDLDDPSADVICAALVLNARLRGPGLRDVLGALAQSTREELDMRRRISASRRSIRRSVKIIVVIVLSVMGGLALFNQVYVQPYTTLLGQAVLVVVALLFAGGLLWMRRLSEPQKLNRFLVVDRRSRERDREAAIEETRRELADRAERAERAAGVDRSARAAGAERAAGADR
ncbi:type II secretion system F family protein [Ornithinimicrobium cerasi]|uniref:Type II secretion system (T2SS), protein F n=1 Tax=Ornithinimicrobium cerasi TaxID=2248773 RepID=A0A285VVH5_9MICO|nr:type II secretion system F family protein [Ornithinimicrobium cerasi]SOC57521.1 Type II secretion system (T2SS), protein F [Ornithinimicrobium cerasi]SOC57598.1 Type II secretion system (T2SS), protein F [Ornithinimicrobium cerasi]